MTVLDSSTTFRTSELHGACRVMVYFPVKVSTSGCRRFRSNGTFSTGLRTFASSGEGLVGSGLYELVGIVSHVGKSAVSGHYVCHVRMQDGQWAFFNDRKVSWSVKTPFKHGFMYLYRSKEVE